MSRQPRTAVICAVAVLAGTAVAPSAEARRGGDDVRVSASCTGRADARLKLSREDGGIEAEFELEHARRGSSWRVVVVQEGRVVRRVTVRASSALGRFERRFVLRDLAGADRVSVRAQATDGSSCRAAATLAGG